MSEEFKDTGIVIISAALGCCRFPTAFQPLWIIMTRYVGPFELLESIWTLRNTLNILEFYSYEVFLFRFSILKPFVHTFRESWLRCRSTQTFWISILRIFWNCNFKISFSNLSNYIYQIRNSWYTVLIFNIRLGVYIRLSMCGLFTSVSPCLGSSRIWSPRTQLRH